mgnify:FL=1
MGGERKMPEQKIPLIFCDGKKGMYFQKKKKFKLFLN